MAHNPPAQPSGGAVPPLPPLPSAPLATSYGLPHLSQPYHYGAAPADAAYGRIVGYSYAPPASSYAYPPPGAGGPHYWGASAGAEGPPQAYAGQPLRRPYGPNEAAYVAGDGYVPSPGYSYASYTPARANHEAATPPAARTVTEQRAPTEKRGGRSTVTGVGAEKATKEATSAPATKMDVDHTDDASGTAAAANRQDSRPHSPSTGAGRADELGDRRSASAKRNRSEMMERNRPSADVSAHSASECSDMEESDGDGDKRDPDSDDGSASQNEDGTRDERRADKPSSPAKLSADGDAEGPRHGAGGTQTRRNTMPEPARQRLEEVFSRNRHPSSSMRVTLGGELGIAFHKVTNWFRNRRQKESLLRRRVQEGYRLQDAAQFQPRKRRAVDAAAEEAHNDAVGGAAEQQRGRIAAATALPPPPFVPYRPPQFGPTLYAYDAYASRTPYAGYGHPDGMSGPAAVPSPLAHLSGVVSAHHGFNAPPVSVGARPLDSLKSEVPGDYERQSHPVSAPARISPTREIDLSVQISPRERFKMAVKRGDVRAVRSILAGGDADGGTAGAPVDPNLRLDGEGNTALHIAAAAGSPDVIRLLLDSGASADIRNNNGDTPLHSVVRFEHCYSKMNLPEIAGFFTSFLSCRNSLGLTPLIEAARNVSSPWLIFKHAAVYYVAALAFVLSGAVEGFRAQEAASDEKARAPPVPPASDLGAPTAPETMAPESAPAKKVRDNSGAQQRREGRETRYETRNAAAARKADDDGMVIRTAKVFVEGAIGDTADAKPNAQLGAKIAEITAAAALLQSATDGALEEELCTALALLITSDGDVASSAVRVLLAALRNPRAAAEKCALGSVKSGLMKELLEAHLSGETKKANYSAQQEFASACSLLKPPGVAWLDREGAFWDVARDMASLRWRVQELSDALAAERSAREACERRIEALEKSFGK